MLTDAETTDELRIVSPAPRRVRVSFLCRRTQVDVSLPLDVPVVELVPRLVKLAGAHEDTQPDASDDPPRGLFRHCFSLVRANENDSPGECESVAR